MMTDLDRAILNGLRTDTTHGAGVSYLTQKHEHAEATSHARTIRAMRDDRSLGLGRYYGPECYNGSPGFWRRVTRNKIAFRHDTRRGPASHTLWDTVY